MKDHVAYKCACLCVDMREHSVTRVSEHAGKHLCTCIHVCVHTSVYVYMKDEHV